MTNMRQSQVTCTLVTSLRTLVVPLGSGDSKYYMYQPISQQVSVKMRRLSQRRSVGIGTHPNTLRKKIKTP